MQNKPTTLFLIPCHFTICVKVILRNGKFTFTKAETRAEVHSVACNKRNASVCSSKHFCEPDGFAGEKIRNKCATGKDYFTMVFLSMLCSANSLGMKDDYPPGSHPRNNTTHMDIFMALFMMCAIEVVIIKIMTYDEFSVEERRSSASIWFEGLDPDTS